LREIIDKFRNFLKESGLRNTLLSNNKELVDLLERKQLFFFEKNVFVTFGWILYTSILFDSAKIRLSPIWLSEKFFYIASQLI